MIKISKLWLITLGVAGLLAAHLALAAGAASAQDAPVDQNLQKRLQRIEKDVREVRAIVLQAKATGQPVELRTASSDDQITALQTKLDDLDQTVRALTGQVEALSHDIDVTRKDSADTHAQAAVLADRLDKLERQVASLAAPPPPPAPTAQAAPDAGGPQAEPAATGDAGAAYARARQLLLTGDYTAAAEAFQGFIDTYADSPSTPAAHYWLGEIKFTGGDYDAAASHLIASIRGWPKTPWAPDAMVKLALSLSSLNKPADACATLTEFTRHYPRAAPAAKAHAAEARAKIGCSRQG